MDLISSGTLMFGGAVFITLIGVYILRYNTGKKAAKNYIDQNFKNVLMSRPDLENHSKINNSRIDLNEHFNIPNEETIRFEANLGKTKEPINSKIPSSIDGGIIGTSYAIGLNSEYTANFLNSIENFAHQQFGSAGDVSAYLNGLKDDTWWKFAVDNINSGSFNSLKGHLGEHFLADKLQSNGADIMMAPSGNTPGWDFNLNGVDVQLKTVKNFSGSYSEHLNKYPDTPILFNGDANNLPTGIEIVSTEELANLHLQSGDVLAVSDFTLEDMENSLNAEIGDHLDGGIDFPAITACLSLYREFGLYSSDKTDFITSSKNIALDVVGTGAGGALGAKIGLTVGALGGPVGMAIGAGLGGLLGSIFGREVTNAIKTEKFDNERDKLTTLYDNLALSTSQLDKKMKKIDSLVKKMNEEFRKNRKKYLKQISSDIESSHHEIKKIENEIILELVKLYKIEQENHLNKFESSLLPFKNGFVKELNNYFKSKNENLNLILEKNSINDILDVVLNVILSNNQNELKLARIKKDCDSCYVKIANLIAEKILTHKINFINKINTDSSAISDRFMSKDLTDAILDVETNIQYIFKQYEIIVMEGNKLGIDLIQTKMPDKIDSLSKILKSVLAIKEKVYSMKKNQLNVKTNIAA